MLSFPCLGVPLYWDDLSVGNCYVDIVRTTSHQTFEARHPFYEIQMEYQVYDCECKLRDCSSSATSLSFGDLADLRQENYSHPHHFLYMEGIYGDASNPDWVDSYNYLLLTSVAAGACSGKSSLQSVRLPDTLKRIGDGAFSNCPNLTSATIPNSVTNIEGSIFSGCPNLAAIACASGGGYVSVDGVLYNSARTKLIKFPEGKTDRFFVVPATVTELAPYCFANTKLVAIQFAGDKPDADSTSFSGSSLVAYYPKGRAGWTKLDDDEAWGEHWSGIRLYPIPAGGEESIRGTVYHYEIVDGIAWCYVVANGEASLEFKPRLSGGWGHEASIPWGIQGEVVVPSTLGGHPVRRIGGEALCCGSYSSVIIPNSVCEIAGDAFCYNGSQWTSVTIPSSVTNIGVAVFECSSGLTEILVDSDNRHYTSRNGVLFNRDMSVLVEAPPGISGEYVIPNGVTNVMADAFCSCYGLTSVKIPDSVVSIGHNAFYWCDDSLFDTNSVSGAQIVDGWVSTGSTHTYNPVEVIGDVDLTGVRGIVDGAFSSCNQMTSVTIPGTVPTIGRGTFSSCSGLKTVTIENGVTGIGAYAFSWCSELSSISIPDSVTSIGDYAFSGCSGLSSISIPDSVTSIGEHAFSGCSGLEEISIDFDLYASLDSLDLPQSCKVCFLDGPPIVIATDATLPVALTDIRYWQKLEAVGGMKPYSWELVDGDALPEWLTSYYLDAYDALSGQPYEHDIGTYTFALRVTDAEGTSAERTFTIEVQENPNHAPEIGSWSPAASRFRLDPGATTNLSIAATDPDGDELVYYWYVYDENWNLLESYDSTSASFAFSRTAGNEGTYVVQVGVSDGLRTAWNSWTVLVRETPPLAIVTDATLPVALTGVPYWQALEVSGGEEPYVWEIVDEDDWPGWLTSYYLEEYGELSGEPYEDDVGTYAFALRVTDAEGTSVERTFALEVQEDPNRAPVIESRSPDPYSVAIRVGGTAFFSVEASDPDGDDIEISWSLFDGDGNWIADLATNAQGQIEFSRTEGVYCIEARASDGSKEAYASWDVTVVSADAPLIDTDLPHAIEGVEYSVQLTATGGTAPYAWSTDYWAAELSDGGRLWIDTDWDAGETVRFDVTVTDAAGRSTTQSLTIVIEANPNQRPAIDSFTPEWDDNNDFATTPIGVPIVFSVEAHDPEGEPLTYVWKLDDEPLEETGSSWTWTPSGSDHGKHELSVHCSDGERDSDWHWWFFEVVSTNVLRPVVDLPVAVVGEPYSASFSVSGGTEPCLWGGPEYTMAREPNSFAETGTAQDWSGDEECWSVALPFDFPFYGKSYDTIWVSDNGTICLNGGYSHYDYEEKGFSTNALIAPLWSDMDGDNQIISVDDSVSGQITIRWDTHPYWSGRIVNFSATLRSDGTIRFSYGWAATVGAVGISAGDGVRFLLPDELQDAELGEGDDIVFLPSEFAPGMTLSRAGVVSGTPTAAGTYRTPVRVVDGDGTSWNGTAELYVIEANAAVTRTTPVPVPHSWLLGHGLGNGTAAGYETAANANAANGRPVWACYVADLDPTNADADLVANIEMEDGEPVISILRGESPNRVYETQGATAPGGPWGVRTKGSRFFRIKAGLPASPN